MNKIQNIVLGVIALGLIVVGWQVFHLAPPFTPGAVTSPDIPGHYISVGGVREWSYKADMLSSGNASTTVCSFRSPNATSTIQFVSANVSSTSVSVLGLDIGYSQGLASSTNETVTPAVPTATTTILARIRSGNLGPFLLSATSTIGIGGPPLDIRTNSAGAVVSATSTALAIAENIIFPRSYVNVNVGANASTTGLISGSCKIRFTEL